MNEIISVQYRVIEYIFTYIQKIDLPYFQNIFSKNTHFFENNLVEFLWVFIFSLLIWLLWRMFCSVFSTYWYNTENYNWILFFNIFFIPTFLYGLFWWKFYFKNILILFIGNIIFFAIWFPDKFIEIFK